VISQAFVLGAGLGTRLKSLTQHRPKPLIPIANRPLITYAFDHLIDAGVERFVINTHWRAEEYTRAFPEAKYRGVELVFRHEKPEVLETAGGIKNAEDLLGGGPFWVYNGDILCTLPLEAAMRAHRDARNEVTLVIRSFGGPLQVTFDEASGRVLDLGRRLAASSEPRFLFSGIYLIEPEFFSRIPSGKISVVPIFCEMIRAGARLGGVVIDDGAWFDLGTREQILAVHHHLGRGPWIDPSAEIGAGVVITGASSVGAGARIGPNSQVHDSVIWDRGEVAADASLRRCIVVSGQRASGELSDVDVA
jgi:NDP-sugar pyrophosphorylase family protein